MAALNQNFSIFQADDNVLIEFIVMDAAGTKIDVSTASFEWAFSRSAKSAPLITKTTANDISLSDPVNGGIQINMHLADTQTLASGAFYHELVMTLGAKTETIASGTMTLLPSNLKRLK